MKKSSIVFFIAVFLIVTNTISAYATIESAVYDFRIEDDRLEGYSLVVIRADGEYLDNMAFFSDTKFNFITENLTYDENGSKIEIKNLDLKKDERKELVLKFDDEISGQDVNFRLLRFPYLVERTLICVEESRDKFVWKIDFPAYARTDNDMVLMQEGIQNDDIEELDALTQRLRSTFSKEEYDLPRYRVYLGEIKPNEKITVGGWNGKSYEFYLPNIAPVIGICAALLLILYLFLRVVAFPTEKNEVDWVEEEREVNWLKIKAKCEENLDVLEDDEYTVYKEICDSEGEVLQRDLPEKLGFSKAKVSRVLDRLKSRNLIERRSYGVTNKVVLK